MDQPAPDSENLFSTNPEAWLAAIVESSDDAVIGKTLDSVIRSWNHGATRIFGYEPSEAIGKTIYLIIPPERHHEEPDIIAHLVRGERIDHHETVRLRKDGTRIDVSISVSPIRDNAGRIIGAAKVARDISAAKRLQRLEREHAEQLQELASELEQQVEEGQQLQEELEQQVEEAQSLQEELEQTNEEMMRALADTKQARRQAEEAKQLAEDANAAKSQFLAMMSHELRTPLNAIAGYVNLLELEIRGPLTSDQKQDISRIKHSQETLLRLIEDVLSFARLESGRLEYQYEEVKIDTILDALESFLSPILAQKGVAYHLEGCGDEIVASIDRDKVEQIMLNLLANAVKFTDSGRIDVTCSADESHVRIQVRDTGHGIRPELLDKIFEPFVQGQAPLTRTAEGTGLGLAISREFARAMGGDITVESELGRGSVFTLTLPRDGNARNEREKELAARPA
ncbi:MAG TPA: ATP-binding protein [Gemmatimonadaceae bacterium]|nr:ATP-binding protein [Gemmatimonadaceae bacterium]